MPKLRPDGTPYLRDGSPGVLRDDAGSWQPDPLRPGVQVWTDVPKTPKRAAKKRRRRLG